MPKKDRNKPSVYGVGYMGYGSANRASTSYPVWKVMLARCYAPETGRWSHYTGCIVCEDWKCLQVFDEWFRLQCHSGRYGFAIDKDLTVRDNKIYSPETCCLVPRAINNTLVGQGYARHLPTGVYMDRNCHYYARISVNDTSIHLGTYKTVDEARAAYVKAKRIELRRLAELWKNDIPQIVYNNLITWEFD